MYFELEVNYFSNKANKNIYTNFQLIASNLPKEIHSKEYCKTDSLKNS